MQTTEPNTSAAHSVDRTTTPPTIRKRKVTKQRFCPTCIRYSEEFTRFFKEAHETVITKKGERIRLYKQKNDLKTGKKSLQEFEEMKAKFVNHFNDAHVPSLQIADGDAAA